MIFSSMTFIFVFLPTLLTVYFLTKDKYKNFVLLISSIIFYAWGDIQYLKIMLSVIFLNYVSAISIEKFVHQKKEILILSILLNIGVLLYFKYFNFFISIYKNLINPNIDLLNIVLPLGISFYIFQAMSYIIDVYRQDVKAQKNILKLALYICLFPQLIAGPIVKYHDISEQIDSRTVNFNQITYGVKRFITGLAKKLLIANTLGLVADKIFTQDPACFTTQIAWIGAIAFSLQLYFDFSGYTDIAIGLGNIFGFNFKENFNYPYISKSISEFWRRWHISLSTWFKEYVYISLGGNKVSKIITIRNLAIVFFLTGFWHGAAFTFIVWGLWHGLFIIMEKLFDIEKNKQINSSKLYGMIMHVYTLMVCLIGWVIFRADNLPYALKYLSNMFGLLKVNPNDFMYAFPYYVETTEIIAFVVAIICSAPIFKNLINSNNLYIKIAVNVYLLLIFFLSVITLAPSTYNPFIYFRF